MNFMLINFYQKTLEAITQWFKFTGDIIYPERHTVRIRVKESDEHLQYGVQRKMRAFKYKR